jgi:protoporphyrinogen oxidase
VRDRIVAEGNDFFPGAEVVRIQHEEGAIRSVTCRDGRTFEGTHFYPTMPIFDLVHALDPAPEEAVLEAGSALTQRSFMVVALLVQKKNLFPDQWLYIQDPHVKVSRITNFENWKGEEEQNGSPTRLALEYFSPRNEGLWNWEDEKIVKMAAGELHAIGLMEKGVPVEGCVKRIPNAYPVYDKDYAVHRDTIKEWIRSSFSNVYPSGRGGLHNYNSQDHAMMTATLSVKNMAEGASFDVWSVNTDQEYAEEMKGEDRGWDRHLKL